MTGLSSGNEQLYNLQYVIQFALSFIPQLCQTIMSIQKHFIPDTNINQNGNRHYLKVKIFTFYKIINK